MGLIPQSKIGKIQFFNSKVTPWTDNAVAIGTTAAEVTAMQTKLTAAQAAMDAKIAAYAAAQAATETLDSAVAALVNAGSDIIKQIRAKAATAGDSVYQLAQIPAPATPSPVGKPGTPFGLKVELKPDGSIELKWKCTNPVGAVGTIYHVYRQDNGVGDFNFLGGSGQKDFIDATVPAGSMAVVYKIQALRSNSIGDANEFTVKFGVGGGGAMTASVEPGPKLAA